jgi:SAM-dependent methyltransferase
MHDRLKQVRGATGDAAALGRRLDRRGAGMSLYDSIGVGYAARRREDPRIAAVLWAALGDARSVVNVGAGTGSYEPPDREVIPVEPSAVMLAQRPAHRAPAVLGVAENLPLADKSVDAAMTVLSIHHWQDQAAGLAELVRVARNRVVILTIDPVVSGSMWLIADYLPEVAALDNATFPDPADVAARLGGRVETVLVPADCSDGFLLSFWAHPDRVLEPDARATTSAFARMPDAVVRRAVTHLERDLADGSWDRRHEHLRRLPSFDAGLRLILSELT